MKLIIDIPKDIYNFIKDRGHLPYAVSLADSISDGIPYEVILDHLASRIAGHSDYHGDSILIAIESLKEGKSPKDIYIPVLNEEVTYD